MKTFTSRTATALSRRQFVGTVAAASLAPRAFAQVGDKTVRIWKLPSLKSVVCKGHMDYVTCLTTVTNPVDENLPPTWRLCRRRGR